MNLSVMFFVESILLGVGLAMDAFSVSLANGLNEPCMSRRKMSGVAGVFALFQAVMPLIGWICVHTVAQHFAAFERLIPWIALGLLGFIGGKMLYEGIACKDEDCDCNKSVCFALLSGGPLIECFKLNSLLAFLFIQHGIHTAFYVFCPAQEPLPPDVVPGGPFHQLLDPAQGNDASKE